MYNKIWNSTRLVVPVSEFVSKSFINRTLIDSDMIRTVTLTVSPHTDIAALRASYEGWMERDDRVGDADTYECYVIGQGEFGLEVRLCAHVNDPRNGWDVECELREAIVGHLVKGKSEYLPNLGTGTGTGTPATLKATD